MSEITLSSEESTSVIACNCAGITDLPFTSSVSVDTSGDTADQTPINDQTSSCQHSSSTISKSTFVTAASVNSVQAVSVSQAPSSSHIR